MREDVIVRITREEFQKLRTCWNWLEVCHYPRIDLADKNEAGRIEDVRFFFKEWKKDEHNMR
jgi:hypothetical protein